MPTPAEVKELSESIIEEQKALLDKFPAWAKLTVGVMFALLLAAAIAACAAVSTATGPGAPVAMMACIAAIIALLAFMINQIMNYLDESSEADAIKEKMNNLERMKRQLEAGS